MFKVVAAGLLLLVLNYGILTATAIGDGDFFPVCQPSRCSRRGTEIRFPFRLESSPVQCGAPGMQLSCSPRGDTILRHPILGSCNVSSIDYRYGFINVIPLAGSWSQCPLQTIISNHPSTKLCDEHYPCGPASLVKCSTEFTPTKESSSFGSNSEAKIVGPISCLSSSSEFMYLVAAYEAMSVLPFDCKVVLKGIPIPYSDSDWVLFKDSLLFYGNVKRSTPVEMRLVWSDRTEVDESCQGCKRRGGHCRFNSSSRLPFCKHHGSHVKVVAATSSVATFLVVLLLVITILYRSLKRKYDEEIHLKVEMFLKTYGTSKPTRYTFSQVKKMTRRFKDKLGQGGFGSVYKGELPNGVPVAVKMLENSKGEGQEFINEVATIGRIHHANVVRLLGFCSEGTRRALIYEFMPNESLEKYIFSQDYDISQRLLVPNKMLEIALGIARGIEYLHQGCNQRIVHFDIKPHNILLDYSFNPKISDFGLAKLCARDQSIVTLTAARGTMGYIAPELYSRNFGTVSYKSDVYSFGMLVLEMVSRKRNSDPWIENQNELYVPEWIYEKIVAGQELGVTQEMTQGEKDTIRKLAIVALWCIQWNPVNRPSATKVVNMLSGNLQNLQMPPKPFVSCVIY